MSDPTVEIHAAEHTCGSGFTAENSDSAAFAAFDLFKTYLDKNLNRLNVTYLQSPS